MEGGERDEQNQQDGEAGPKRAFLGACDIYSITPSHTTVEHAYLDALAVRGGPFAAFVCIRRFPPRVGRLPVKSTVTAGGTELASDALASSAPHSTSGSYAVLPLTRCRLTGRLDRDKKREQYELVATSFHYPGCTKRNWNNRSQVSIPELGIVLETAPDKIKRDDAVDLALAAISDNQL